MGFVEHEQKRSTRKVVSVLSGVKDNQENEIENDTLEVQRGKGRPKENREIKKRVSVAVYPSLYENIGKIAYVDRESISEIVSRCLEEYVEKNQDKLEEYERLKK